VREIGEFGETKGEHLGGAYGRKMTKKKSNTSNWVCVVIGIAFIAVSAIGWRINEIIQIVCLVHRVLGAKIWELFLLLGILCLCMAALGFYGTWNVNQQLFLCPSDFDYDYELAIYKTIGKIKGKK